jgi:hypothetical protein
MFYYITFVWSGTITKFNHKKFGWVVGETDISKPAMSAVLQVKLKANISF